MTSLMVIPSALENSAASFGTGRMSGHHTIRVNPAMIPAGMRARPSRAEQDAESEGGDGEYRRDPGDGSLVAALTGEHPLRCWHVQAAVQPAEHLQHPGEMGIRPEQAGFDVAELTMLAIAEAHRRLLTRGLLRDAGPAYCVPPAQARSWRGSSAGLARPGIRVRALGAGPGPARVRSAGGPAHG